MRVLHSTSVIREVKINGGIPQVITEDRASGAQVIEGSLKFDSSKTQFLEKTFASAETEKLGHIVHGLSVALVQVQIICEALTMVLSVDWTILGKIIGCASGWFLFIRTVAHNIPVQLDTEITQVVGIILSYLVMLLSLLTLIDIKFMLIIF